MPVTLDMLLGAKDQRIAELEAELAAAQAAHAKAHEEAADWRRLHAELLTELAPWREMARQLEALIEAGWIPIHWQWEYPGNWIAFRDDEDRTVSGRGPTLPEAVAAAYEQVMGVGDECIEN